MARFVRERDESGLLCSRHTQFRSQSKTLAAVRLALEVGVDLVASGETIAVVVRVQQRPAGAWAVCVERADCPSVELPLAPATFVVRLWRDARTRTLRGTLELAGSEHSAPVQSNEQIIEMALAWLDGRPGGGS